MNKLTKIPVILIILFFGCTQQKDKIIGCWIEKDNFQNPIQVEFMDFSYRQKVDNSITENLYHIDKDTFYTCSFAGFNKSKINFSGNEFRLIDILTDSVLVTFERNIAGSFIDYFNSKMKTSIELVDMKASDFDFTPKFVNNVYFADYVDNQLQLYTNTVPRNFNDTSNSGGFKKIYLDIGEDDEFIPTTSDVICDWLYLDKDLKVSDIRKIRNELNVYEKYILNYVTSKNDSLFCISTKITLREWEFLDEYFIDKNIPCYFSDSFCIMNKDTVNWEQILFLLKEKIIINPHSIIQAYFDDEMSCDNYLSSFYGIQSLYFEIRDSILTRRIGINSNINLDLDSLKETIKEQYPRRINELDIETYLKMKYAL